MEISKRDYFAAQALTGLLARSGRASEGTNMFEQIALEAYQYADEMLKLSKTLLDPVEFDPEKMGEAEDPRLKEKSDTTKPPKAK